VDPDLVKIAELALIALVTGAGVVTFWGATRWINSRTSRSLPATQRTPMDDARLERLETAIDAIAVEVERVAESQRFTAKLLAERRAEQLPPAAPFTQAEAERRDVP
jgi:hypothetical protein